MKYSFTIAAADKCANMLSRIRNEAGLSRKEMSEVMDVSETTIRAWENGQGSPTLLGMLLWFRAAGSSALRPLASLLCPERFGNATVNSHETDIREALSYYFSYLAGPEEIAKLDYLIFGTQGPEWPGLLDMALAYVNASLDSRCRAAENIQTSYALFLAAGQLEMPDGLSVNRELLDAAKAAARNAVAEKLGGYAIFPGMLLEKEDYSEILLRSRLDAGATQQQMAKALGKTTRTVQNWESGYCPSFLELQLWFHALDVEPWPYIRTLLYPGLSRNVSDAHPEKRGRIVRYMQACPEEVVKKLTYLMGGPHGSDWYAVLEILFAHSCEPLAQRILSAQAVLLGYTMDRLSQKQQEGWELPNLENLKRCIERGIQTAMGGKDGAA